MKQNEPLQYIVCIPKSPQPRSYAFFSVSMMLLELSTHPCFQRRHLIRIKGFVRAVGMHQEGKL